MPKCRQNESDSDRSISPLENFQVRKAGDSLGKNRAEKSVRVRTRRGDRCARRASSDRQSEEGRKRVKLDEDVGSWKGGDDVGWGGKEHKQKPMEEG